MMQRKLKVKIAPKQEKDVFIQTDFIRLDAALKLADAVQTGGHAKIVITEGEVKVNGEVCLQRGRKLRDGDTFSLDSYIFTVKKEQ